MKVFVWTSTIAISISTLFMKQHAFLDIVASIILSAAVYYFVTYNKIINSSRARKLFLNIIPEAIRHDFGYFREKEDSDE